MLRCISALTEAGYKPDIDGLFGPAPLKAFQGSCKIEPDGKRGLVTRGCLEK